MSDLLTILQTAAFYIKTLGFYVEMLLGFSLIVFFHELGHFLAAKWAGVRVEQFAIGFFREVFGFTRGETRYSFNILPFGGYVKMLGQEDFEVNKEGELAVKDDPRAFSNRPIGQRMVVVSAGVIMNLFVAALLFMVVFMIGVRAPVTTIGSVLADGPAALAGLEPGDIVRRIDGREINDFTEVTMAVVLANPGRPLKFEIERRGRIIERSFDPEKSQQQGILQVGMTNAQSPQIALVGPDYQLSNPHDPRPGDVIVELNGQPVTDENANDLMCLLAVNPHAVTDLVVERPTDPTRADSPLERVPVQLRPRLSLRPSDNGESGPQLLGLVPLIRVSAVEEDSRADYGGLEVGDTILEWDGARNPGPRQIEKSIAQADPERDIPVRVRRAGQPAERNLVVRPKVRVMPLTGQRKRPNLGAEFKMFADDWLRVASVVDEVNKAPTPAQLAGVPADAVITKVNDEPVSRWIDLAERFRAHAGETLTLTYDLGSQRGLTCQFPVPRCLQTLLGIGPESKIISVADATEEEVTVRGRSIKVNIGHPYGMRTALEKRVGQTVDVKFRRNVLAPDVETASVAVTADMVEPWVALMGYSVDVEPGGQTKLLRKSNPLAAVKIGVVKTYYFVMQVYQTMHRMIFSRSLSAENIQGPVGILKLGRQTAERGPVQLLFFLAVISANLAVINFLPLPIVDGGLMVFLIIEKIKGSPVSIRVQVATQVLGLILLASAFLYVTVQDLMR